MVWLHNSAYKETILDLMNHATKVYEMNNNFIDRNIHYVFFCKQSILGPISVFERKTTKRPKPKNNNTQNKNYID